MYKEINLDEWTLCGEGAQGQSYESAKYPDLLLKLFFAKETENSAFLEHRMSSLAKEVGVVTPDPGEIVTDGKRMGLCLQKIRNKRSFARIICHEPGRLKEIATTFAVEAKKLHSIPLGDDEVPDYREALIHRVFELKFKPEREKQLVDFLHSLPEPSCYNHGDLHMGNMINDGKTDYWIDLGFFCKGIPEYDISMLYFVCRHTPFFVMKKVFHMSVRQGCEFWRVFVDEYFGPDSSERRESIRLIKDIEKMKLTLMAKRSGFGPWFIPLLTLFHPRF